MPTEERIALKLSERKKRGSRVPKTANRIKIKRKIPNSRFLKRKVTFEFNFIAMISFPFLQ
jgi:hypothetical protein